MPSNKMQSKDIKVKSIQELLRNCIDMKYYKKNQLSRYFLTYQNEELEERFLYNSQNFHLAKVLIIQSFVWNILLIITGSIDFWRIFQAAFDVIVILGYNLVSRRYKKYFILSKQLLVTYLICLQLTVSVPGWRSLMNGAAFIIWILVDYQNIVIESIGIMTSIIFAIVVLRMDWYIMGFFLFAGFILIGYRYSYDKQERLLFLALQNFQEWQKVVEKTMPAYFFVQSMCYRNFSMELYDQNKKFFNDFIKENQSNTGKAIKQELRNDIYLQFLKDVKIIGNYSRVKRFSTADTINQISSNSKSEDFQNLFSYLLQKHVEVYNWWLENVKNNKQIRKIEKPNCTFANLFKRLFFCNYRQKKIKYDEEQYPIGVINSPRNSQMPQSQQGIASKCDISINSTAGGRNSNQKQQNLTNESINVVFFNKKLDKNQYFKVNIVPLFLHEPFLSISFQDVSEFHLIKEKQIKEKGLGVINQQSQIFVSHQLESLEKILNGQTNKLLKQINKKLVFLKEILNLQQRNDKNKLELGSFQLNEILESLVNTFSNIKQLNVDKKLLTQQNQQLEAYPQNLNISKQNSKRIQSSENQQFLKLKGLVTSLSCSDLQNYDENIEVFSIKNSDRLQFKIDNESIALPEFGKDGFINYERKKISNRIIPNINNVKTICELQHSQNQLIQTSQTNQSKINENKKMFKNSETEHEQNLITSNNKIQQNRHENHNEDTQNCSQTEYSIYQNNQYASLGVNKKDDTLNQTQGQNISNINFSFENLNNNNPHGAIHNQTTQLADYSFRGESPTYLFPKKLMAQKFLKQLGDNQINEKSDKIKGMSNSIIISEQTSFINSPITIYDRLCQKSNKFYAQLNLTKSFTIYNDISLMKQVLVSLASSYGHNEICLTVSQVQTQFYKSIKFQFEHDKCMMNLIENPSNTVQLGQILGVKGSKYDQLKNKLIENVNLIISQISPNKFKFNGNKLEVEFFYLEENYK
ncbi:transmembrane protein, putative (macronuclear) [Tetrahymena thermophila SB210]|uniref:Transmembrane protein, putative n=1 Tax=Tetrahymena thermophila (strain SB210) TaxID=312017 RepID=Q23A19_TETTS|nr:transmembrane protein, putative [Tetrahymena thermophila SB210]EAR93344.2 transmembrane protein, putative [Tetrahymena thermophila SB210]|eukprot:XP_001013589.2 transmembrane protein, putative [Tetrahymena thermophila SB210]